MTEPLDPYPYPTPLPQQGDPVPQYPPYIPEQDMDLQHMPESTLDGIHGDQGVVIQPPGEKLGPPPTVDGPRMVQPYGPDDPELSRVWVPDHRPLPPGTVVPASSSRTADSDKAGEPASSGAHGLDVNPEDLTKVSDEYSQLAAQAAQFGPKAVEEVQRVIATHGAMGYPLAVGIVTRLAKAEARVTAKSRDFVGHSEKFAEHAHTYRTGDHEDATRLGDLDFPTISV